MPPPTYSLFTQYTIPARSSAAVPVSRSQKLSVINTHGTQVIDFWAFTLPSTTPSDRNDTSSSPSTLTTYLSMSHTRASTLHLSPLVDDTLVTDRREPMLKLIGDTTPGLHDTLIPACDITRYRQLGVPEGEYHANCTDNLFAALSRDTTYTFPRDTAPDPLNLFMNIPVVPLTPGTARAANNLTAGAEIQFQNPICEKGAKVVFEALVDCVVVMSACPQDLVRVNNMMPTEAHFVVEA
ncbi:uncharacterized protein Z518_10897 [Rhinocladiella mackenziei CBS 650.93]|uniref:DUF1989 domain-containing protein n=1 Tax=Rhinocladiella mackenziei CBS 650.93 TaxID=1442369 RepID=A0A0D2ITC1_9EURO|nr:uncharacterized protein Z518_10897 [Rhinocladiella mackenziei CBS 650.93]KIW99969.1 hypothetical protein Z518_10897 [Rhinocladiella mackenziei CBS 650.93]